MGLKKLASRLKLAKIEAQVGYGYGPASRGKEKKNNLAWSEGTSHEVQKSSIRDSAASVTTVD